MSDSLPEAVAFERISIIAKLGSLEACNAYERQVVLTLITDIADDAREEISKKGNKIIGLLDSSHIEHNKAIKQ
ncbi:hypothetical protein V5094_12040 [Moellerella wisconsensis]|uniref:hypothetical protein n=1 Tax=Moellerella wisconsensis TaxID=158849 RepID=UPI003075FA9D